MNSDSKSTATHRVGKGKGKWKH